ncbi:MAG: hypothetical protein RIS52_1544 [Pseudomonadota bacterium]
MSGWIIETMGAVTLLIATVLIIRRPVARAFGPRIAYALWLLPALRMILPPLPGQWFGLARVPEAFVEGTITGHADLIFEGVMALWLGGAALFFAWHMARYLHFSRRLNVDATPKEAQGGIAIGQTELVASPIAFGIFGKKVMLPADFEDRFSDREQYLALGHELTHHKRGDVTANVAALGLLSLNWFNPLAHFAFAAYRADQEAACDATVLRYAPPEDYHVYGSALVKSALGTTPMVACPIGVAHGVKERLAYLVAARDVAPLHQAGLMLSGVMIVAGLGITASGSDYSATAKRSSASWPAFPTLHQSAHAPPKEPTLPQHSVTLASLSHKEKPAFGVTLGSVPVKIQAPKAVSTALPAPSVAPAINQALANADTPRAAPVGLEPKAVLAEAALPCDGAGSALKTEAVFVRDGQRTGYTLTICGLESNDPETQRVAVLGGLQAARARIVGDDRLPVETRMQLAAVLDFQIEALSNTPV